MRRAIMFDKIKISGRNEGPDWDPTDIQATCTGTGTGTLESRMRLESH